MATILNHEIAAKIDAIDLTNARERLMDKELGEGWSAKKADEVIKKYRNFLKMIAAGHRVVPTKDVDLCWHTHILATEDYHRDCNRCFGRYIHHYPYIGKTASTDGFQKTKELYKEMFGEDYVK
jgi:hypothetical protein